MERLTDYHFDGSGAYMVCSGACIDDEFDCNCCSKLKEIVDRLAAYEDTGLEPEEINSIFIYSVIEENRRLKKFSQAEKDGRLVVLPCKVGDTVYSIEPLWLKAAVGEESKCLTCDHFYEGGMGDYPSCLLEDDKWCLTITEEAAKIRNIVGWMDGMDFGKTVFLTREEAEAALKKREEADNEAD